MMTAMALTIFALTRESQLFCKLVITFVEKQISQSLVFSLNLFLNNGNMSTLFSQKKDTKVTSRLLMLITFKLLELELYILTILNLNTIS
jgi:hypothetical protein